MFAISPNSASCERVFALLKRLFGEQQKDVVARRLGAGGADAQLQWALCGLRHMPTQQLSTQLHANSAACQLSTQHVNSELSRLMRLAMYGGLDVESSADLPSDIMARVE